METIKQWAWFWKVGMGGRLAGKLFDMGSTNPKWGSAALLMDLGSFNVELIAGVSKERISPFCDFVARHGDHCVKEVAVEVEDPDHTLERNPALRAAASSRGIFLVNPEPKRPKGGMPEYAKNPWTKGIHHIARAVTREMMEEEASFWEALGGKLTKKMDDVMPVGAPSSMMLWCFDFQTFGVALIAGLDREEESQVTAFTKRNGAPFTQRVAYAVHNLEQFRTHLADDLGGYMRGEILTRPDDFGRGEIKQVFGAGFGDDDPAESSFPEFVECPSGEEGAMQSVTFSQRFGIGLYGQIEKARKTGDRRPLVDFRLMPKDWEP